jgi:lysophospholipase L1-like esterase
MGKLGRLLVPAALMAAGAVVAGAVGPASAAPFRAGTASGGVGPSTGSASAPAISVYPLGDSLTFGASGPYAITPGGYRGTLASDLSSDGVNVEYEGTSTANPPVSTDLAAFRHDGHPGFRIDQVAADLDHSDPYSGNDGGDWMTGNPQHSSIHPVVLALLIGTNDILQTYDPGRTYPGGYDGQQSSERGRFVADRTGRLWSLLGELERLDPGVRLVLCTIPPIGVEAHDPTAAAYNQAIRRQVVPSARLLGMRLALADVEATFLAQPSDQPDLMGPDGVHPTPAGYSHMAGVIAGAVVKILRFP